MGDNRTATSATKPEEARWETWDRNRLLKLVEKLPSTTRVGVSHHAERMYSVFRVWESRSVHLRFEDREGEQHSVVLTEIYDNDRGRKKITWLAGGLRAWIDALEIDRDVLLEALL
jgi:hypothetical protein